MSIFKTSPETEAQNLISDVENFIGKFSTTSEKLSASIQVNEAKIQDLQVQNKGLNNYKVKLEKMSSKLKEFFKDE